MPTRFPTPRRGDVLFTAERGSIGHRNAAKDFISITVQRRIDPIARDAEDAFGHVAIALDTSHALEAMRESEDENTLMSDGRLKQIALWSGVELEFGARLVPLPDIFMPSYLGKTRLAVLRAPESVELSEQAFEIISPFISSIVGSAYSIEALRGSAEEALGLVSPYIQQVIGKWSSTPRDLAHELALADELKASIAQTVPSYVYPFESRTFFCSQLVVDVLKQANQSFAGQLPDTTTPTGLYRLLRDLGWREATESDYSPSSIQSYDRQTVRADCRANYMHALARILINRQQLASQETVKFLSEGLKSMQRYCEETTDRLISRR